MAKPIELLDPNVLELNHEKAANALTERLGVLKRPKAACQHWRKSANCTHAMCLENTGRFIALKNNRTYIQNFNCGFVEYPSSH
jgi:hypothetical protein